MNPVGLISMQYARPFTAEHFHLFDTMRELGYDFVELLVPEPGEIDLADARKALDEARPRRRAGRPRQSRAQPLLRRSAGAPKAGIDYLKYAAETRQGRSARRSSAARSPAIRWSLPVAHQSRSTRKSGLPARSAASKG